MKYVTLSTEEIQHLREGLTIIESLNEYGEPVLTLWLYALTDNLNALDAVKESISYWSDIPEEDVQVTEAVILIPCSSDTLYYLTGSGLVLRDEEAIYVGGSEGPRTVSLRTTRTKVTMRQFKEIAVARDDYGAEDFLRQYGTQGQAKPQVQRTEPAATPAAPQEPTPAQEPQAPKESSQDINQVLDSWL